MVEYEAILLRLERANYLGKGLTAFDSHELLRIPRGENNLADALAMLGSSLRVTLEKPVSVLLLQFPHIDTLEEVAQVTIEIWMHPIIQVLNRDHVPGSSKDVRNLRIKAV